MKLAPPKKVSPGGPVTLENIFQNRLAWLEIREVFARRMWKTELVRPHVRRCLRLKAVHHAEASILILSAAAQKELMAAAGTSRRESAARLILPRTALLIFAECPTLPAWVKRGLVLRGLPAAISRLHENVLESRIKALLQEKIKKTITVHGVALAHRGRGVLIRGESGIGKTTAAMGIVGGDNAWIADDRVVIKKDQRGRLFVSGHRAIKKFIHTGPTGIMEVARLWKASQISERAQLALIIEVNRSNAGRRRCRSGETELMETPVTFTQMTICPTGYFDKNLLTTILQNVTEVD